MKRIRLLVGFFSLNGTKQFASPILNQVYPIPFTRLSQTSIDGCSLDEYRSSQIETAKTEKNQSRWNSSWTKSL